MAHIQTMLKPTISLLEHRTCSVQRPSRQVEVSVSEKEISGVTEDGEEPEVEEQQQQQQQQQQHHQQQQQQQQHTAAAAAAAAAARCSTRCRTFG
ncbi:unnamed protein product [Closterium sp. Yama58-4]|nr:unnamed protein product [Closterium sp. Yama58-4]